MNTNPLYDIIVFGATGFTGRLAALALSQDPRYKLAIAGRNRAKLDAIASLCRHRPDVIVADAHDTESIRDMVKQGRVIASFAGPFALYGEAVIAACSELGRNYCDITGETPFIAAMIERYHTKAIESGACLIPMSGFDSVPGDVVSYIALQEGERHGWALQDLTHYYQIKGGFNGGTLQSALTMAEQKQSHLMNDANVLIPDKSWGANKKSSMAPRYEPFLKKWTAPFFMDPINTAVVRRSIFLKNPSKTANAQISYSERLLLKGGRTGQTAAYGVTGAMGFMGLLTALPIGRSLLRTFGPSAGEGPSEESRKGGYYRGTLLARDHERVRLTVKMKAKGDPGNEFTVLSAITMARLLANGETTARGFSTPTAAFGDSLIRALESEGVTISSEYNEPGLNL